MNKNEDLVFDENKYYYCYVFHNRSIYYFTNADNKLYVDLRILKSKVSGVINFRGKRYAIVSFNPNIGRMILIPPKYVYTSFDEAKDRYNDVMSLAMYCTFTASLFLICILFFFMLVYNSVFLFSLVIALSMAAVGLRHLIINRRNKRIGYAIDYNSFCRNVSDKERDLLLSELDRIQLI